MAVLEFEFLSKVLGDLSASRRGRRLPLLPERHQY